MNKNLLRQQVYTLVGLHWLAKIWFGGLAELAAIVAVGLCYAALLAWYIPLNGLWSGDQGVKLVQVQSLLRNNFSDAALPYPGATLDPAGRFSPLPAMMAWKQGKRYYSAFSYPYAVLSAIPFFFLGYPGLYIIPVLATLATLRASAAIAAKLSVRPAWLVLLLLGLATPLGFYALVLWEHALAVCLASLAVVCVLSAVEHPSRRWALVGGVIAGVAFWMRSEAIWLPPALLAGMIWAKPGFRRVHLAFAGGLMLGLAPLLIAHTLVFGLPLGPAVALNYSVVTLEKLLALRWQIARVLLLDTSEYPWMWGIATLLAVLVALPVPRARPWLALALPLPILYALLATYPLDLRTGLASACPLMLFAGLARGDTRNPAVRLLSVTATIYVAGVLLTAPNDGGAQWGPRYLLPVMPLLVVLSFAGMAALLRASVGARRRLVCLALVGLLAAAVWTQARGIQLLLRSTNDSLRVVQTVDALRHRVVLTDTWYSPELLAQIYYDHTIFLIITPKQFSQLRALLQNSRIDRFSYLTAQPWGSDRRMLDRAGFQCKSVTPLPFDLSLLDCRIAR